MHEIARDVAYDYANRIEFQPIYLHTKPAVQSKHCKPRNPVKVGFTEAENHRNPGMAHSLLSCPRKEEVIEGECHQ